MSKIVVATTQFACSWELERNLDTAESLVRDAAARGANLVLLQELFATPYFCIEQYHGHLALAEPFEQSRVLRRFSALARELGVVLPISWFERAGNACFNSLAMADADGRLLGVYRKTHIPNAIGYQEKEYFSPGDTGFRVWDTAAGRIGVGICWDQWFPEAARAMALQGAELLLYPTAIGSEPGAEGLDSRDHWQLTQRGHAAANIMPVIGSRRHGRGAAGLGHLPGSPPRDVWRLAEPGWAGPAGRASIMSALTKIAMGLALLLGLGAQAAEGAGEATEEKVLRLYNWSDYFAPDTLSEFTRETGIRVIYDVMDSSETLEAKLMAGRSGYDLIFPGDTVAERLMRAGSLQLLDKGKLQHLGDIDPGLARLQQAYPHAKEAVVPYTWGTIGLTYYADAIRQRMPDAPVSSLDMLFKPELAAKFADCGISVIDSPDEVLAVVLHYLGRDPRSGKADDLEAALALLKGIKPYIRKFQSQPVTQLVNGDLCLSLGYSGDMTQARRAAAEAGKRVDFEYRLPKEGSTIWMDTMAIPADAPHPDYAYAFINFVMRPANMAAITNSTGYPTASAKARPMVDATMTANPDIYLDEASYQRLIPGQDIAQSQMRARMRAWTRFKSSL